MELVERTRSTTGGHAPATAAPVPPLAPVSVQGLSDHGSGWRGTTGQRHWWRVRCSDVVDRERCLTVLVDRGRVVLVGPPGETAVLSADQLVQLRAALREAAEQAER
ncbi:hypothetical protein [Saccharothrix syringae]|uniref:hypothetical protein n=1 Tax=Saccharothrix syringae TaxID=103733 RepID=UPI0005257C49|nr:hypothetical protein [Saccharothrix syringae]